MLLAASAASTRPRSPPAGAASDGDGRGTPPSRSGEAGAGPTPLPDDVLARCLAYLPSPIDLARAGAACRSWRAVARGDGLWRPFVLQLWPSLRHFLPPPPSDRSAAASSRRIVLRGPLCRLFALRLQKGDEEEDDREEEGHDGGSSQGGWSEDEDEDDEASSAASSEQDEDEQRAAAPGKQPAQAQGQGQARGPGPGPGRQLQVALRPEAIILHVEMRDLEKDGEEEEEGKERGPRAAARAWMRALGLGRPLYSAAFSLADPQAFFAAIYHPTHYRPRTLPGAFVDGRRLAALLSDNLDEVGSPLLRLDVAAMHAPTGAVLHLPWRGRFLQLVHSFSLEEVEARGGGQQDGGGDDDDEESAIRLILDGGTRGPAAQPYRLDLSFCPAVDLPSGGDPSRPTRPARMRTAPIEFRFYNGRAEEHLDEGTVGDAGLYRRQVVALFLRFLAAVGGEAGAGVRGRGWQA